MLYLHRYRTGRNPTLGDDRARLRPLERAAFFKGYAEKKYKNIIQGQSSVFGNAATRLEEFVVKGGNYAYGSYPEIDELFPLQAVELDRTKRAAILTKTGGDPISARFMRENFFTYAPQFKLTIPGSILLLASSPYAKKGELYNAYRRHYGKDDARVLVWKADAGSMNPRIDPAIIEEACLADEVEPSPIPSSWIG